MGVELYPYFSSGQLLDEVAMRCVDPSQCKVCIHEGQRISHGNKVILNHDDPDHCKIWYYSVKTLSCKAGYFGFVINALHSFKML